MEALVNHIIKAIGWSIYHSLWHGAVLYALLLLILRIVPEKNARLKHNIAYATLSILFMGFCYTFYTLFTWTTLTTGSQIAPVLVRMPTTISRQAEQYFPLLAGIYGLGIIIQFILLSSGYYKIRKLKQSLRINVPQEWQALFQRIKKDLQIHKKVGFHLSNQVTVPLVIGFFKPLVLFPVAFASQLEITHVEAILIHELSHIRRNDYLLNMLKTAMETILFFNPFMWLCSNLIQREREHACDDLVIKQTHTPLTYAHALLKIELIKVKQTPAFSMAAGGNNQHLYQRIKRITAMKTNYNNARQQVLVLTLTIATLASLAWVSPTKSKSFAQPIIPAAKVHAPILLKKLVAPQDTTKKKKIKVITKNAKGHKKEYHTIIELPDSLRNEVMEERMVINTPAFKKQMEEIKMQSITIAKHFNSPEWKKQMEEIKKQSVTIAKQFNTPEWKKKMEDIKSFYNSQEYKELQSKFQKEVEELQHRKAQEAERKN